MSLSSAVIPRRILIIDDDPVHGDGLVEYFRLQGYDAEWTVCLVGALAHMAIRKYDVIVTDLVVACLSPAKLINGLLSGPNTPKAIVVMTQLSPGDDKLAVVPPGIPIIHEPVDPEQLLEVVKAIAPPTVPPLPPNTTCPPSSSDI